MMVCEGALFVTVPMSETMATPMRRSRRKRRFGRKYGVAIFMAVLIVAALAVVGGLIYLLNQPNRYFSQ